VFDLTGIGVPRISGAELLELGTTEEVLGSLEVIGVQLKHGRLPFDSEVRWLGSALERIGLLALQRSEDGSRPCDNRAALARIVLRELGLSRKTRISPNETLAREWLADDLVRQGVRRSDALALAARIDLIRDDVADQVEGDAGAESLEKHIKRLKRSRSAPTK